MYPANDYRNYLQHSAKGTHWKSGHKYKYIKNGRYYYDDEGSGDGSSVGSKVKSTVGKVSSAMNGIKDKALSSFGAARDEARAIKSDYQSERAYLSTRREAASTALGGAINRRNERKKANAAKNKPNKKKQSSFSKLSSKFKNALSTGKNKFSGTKKPASSTFSKLKTKYKNALNTTKRKTSGIANSAKRKANSIGKSAKRSANLLTSSRRRNKAANDVIRNSREKSYTNTSTSAKRLNKRGAYNIRGTRMTSSGAHTRRKAR